MQINVHEASKELNVSVDTIRRWDKKGLIRSARSSLNYRLFDLSEIRTLNKKLNGSTRNENNYRILTTSRKSKYSVIELFAGAGGTALGFKNAGLNHVLLNEIDRDACNTLKYNFGKDSNIICDNVKNIDFSKYQDVDVVQAGFPCQSFSYAGKSKGFEDTRGTLFFEFTRCIKETKPKIAVGENVKGLLKHNNGKTLEIMINSLKELGYNVEYKVLRAQYLDVPQKRERLIIMAIRKDLNIPFIFPKEKNYFITIGEALANCPVSVGQKYPKRKAEILDMVPQGGCWRDLPIDIQKEYMKASFYQTGGRTGMARRLSLDEPCLTLTCSPAQKQTERCHPTETRPLNIREYARIQTFPDDWKFSGSITSQYKQIGNAVPVNLAFHIGECIVNMINKSN